MGEVPLYNIHHSIDAPGCHSRLEKGVQGYLAHKKTLLARTLHVH